MEEAFENLLINLKPSRELFELAQATFRMIWDKRRNNQQHNHSAVIEERKEIDNKIEKLVNRVLNTESSTLVRTYEQSIKEMEHRKVELDEKIKHCGRPLPEFDSTFRTALSFLSNPHKLWLSDELIHKRTVLKLVFTEKLAYDLKEGFRTTENAAIAQPFRLLEQLKAGHDCHYGMVPGAGLEPARSQ